MIRIQMFVKYARMNLQEAEAAIQEGLTGKALERCGETALALLKALDTALPFCGKDVQQLRGRDLAAVLEDITQTPEEAREIACRIDSLRDCQAGGREMSRIEAERMYALAGEAFRMVHNLFAKTNSF